jgi:hypothetical protein
MLDITILKIERRKREIERQSGRDKDQSLPYIYTVKKRLVIFRPPAGKPQSFFYSLLISAGMGEVI